MNQVLSGNLSKMVSSLGSVVDYQLPVGDDLLPMNELVGKKTDTGIPGGNTLLSLWQERRRKASVRDFVILVLKSCRNATPVL